MVFEAVTQAIQGMYTRLDQSSEPLVVVGLQCDQAAGVSVDRAVHNLPSKARVKGPKVRGHSPRGHAVPTPTCLS